MKTGLLMCDHVHPKYQETFGDYSHMFQNLFPELEFIIYDVCNGELPYDLDECEVYMATGSRRSVYDSFDWIIRLKKLVKAIYNNNKYFIGFCFGHQLIGEALGGKVANSPKGWCVGALEFDVIDQKPWMVPFQDQVNLLMMCQDQILELPEHSQVLASNFNCPNAMIQVGNKFLGIQAHPEFTKSYDQLLIESRVKRLGEEVVGNGIDSLSKVVHAEFIRDWVMEFINTQ